MKNKKTEKELKDSAEKELQKKSFADEIKNDISKFETVFKRADQDTTSHEEKGSTAVLKRALVLIGAGGLEITDSKSQKDGADNNLPVSSYLSHGSRVMIEIPANTDDKLINWLTSGDKTQDGRSSKYSQDDAYKETKNVYARRAATHEVIINKNNDDTTTLEEKKGFGIGLKSAIKSFFAKTKHLGVDLAMGVEPDTEGFKPDGEHGHLYIYYDPPTKTKPGAMLIGIERGSPNSKQHSISGKAGKVSAAGGSKLKDLGKKLAQTNEDEGSDKIENYDSDPKKYTETIIPSKYNGMNAKLTEASLEEIIKIKPDEFNENLSRALPGKDLNDFRQKINSRQQIYTEEIDSSISIDDITTQKIAKQDSPDGIIQISSDEFKVLDKVRNKNTHQIYIEETQIGPKEIDSIIIPIDEIITKQTGKDQKVVKTTNRMINFFTRLKIPLPKIRNRNNSKKAEKINLSNGNGGGRSFE